MPNLINLSKNGTDNGEQHVHQNDSVKDDGDDENDPLSVCEAHGIFSLQTNDGANEDLLPDDQVLIEPLLLEGPEVSDFLSPVRSWLWCTLLALQFDVDGLSHSQKRICKGHYTQDGNDQVWNHDFETLENHLDNGPQRLEHAEHNT